MKNFKNHPLKLISLNIPEEMYLEIKQICKERETTMTMFIYGAILKRLKLENRPKE